MPSRVELADKYGVAIDAANPLNAQQPMFNVTGSTLTRPANTTAYAAYDAVSDNGTAGSVTATYATISDTNDAPVCINEVRLESTDTGLSGVRFRLYIYNSDPTASSGVSGGDNAAFSNKKAGFIGSFVGTFTTFSDGAQAILVPEADGLPMGGVRICNPESGGKKLWYQLQTLSAFTPSANSTTFIPKFKGWQGRLAA